MTSSTQSSPTKTPPVQQQTANEWGQISNLEPHATYFVVRKPTPEYTREQSRRLVEDVRAFVHEQRVLAERQMKELNEKYGETARSRVNEIRSTLEKRFDEVSKELEHRIEKIEHELSDRGILKTKKDETATPAHAPGETPGEMPTGHHDAGSDASKTTTPKKKASAKKDE